MTIWTIASAKRGTNSGLRLAIALVGRLGMLMAILVATERAGAATYTWDSDGNDSNNAQDGGGTWSTTNLNWFLNNATPDIGWTSNTTDVALFGISGGTGGAIAISGNLSAGGIQFAANDPGSFSFSGTQTLTLGTNGIFVQSGAGSETFGSGINFALAGGQTWTNSSSNTLTVGGNISLAGAGTQTLSLAGAGDRTLSGNLSNGAGTLALFQSGAGTLTLSGTNSFTGGLSASAGTLKATTSASALGGGSLSLGGAALVLANDTGLTFGNVTTITASTTITSDRLTSGAGVTHTLGNLTLGASTLTVNAGANVTSGTAGITFGNVSLTTSPTFAVNSGATLQLGQLNFNNNKFSFTKSGAGTLILGNSATATNTNDTTPLYQLLITGGTVQANAADVADQVAAGKAPVLDINPASGIAVFNAQTFNQGFEHLVVGGAYNFGTSTGTVGAAGTASNITGTGTVTVRSGQIVYNGGLSTATGPIGSTISPNLASAATFNIGHVTGNAADATFSGSINAGTATGWTKTGAGIMVLSGNGSTNSGTFNDSQGVVSLQNANALGSSSILVINPGAGASAFLDLGTGNTSFVRPWGTAAGQITVGNNTSSAIDGFQTSSLTGASLNINNGGSAPVWSQAGFQPGTLQLGTTSSLGPLTFVGGITLVGTGRPIQVDRGNFTLGAGNANLTSANNYFDAQITQVGSTLNAGTIAKSGTGVLSIAGTSTDTNANSYSVNNGVLLLSNGATGNAIGTDNVSVSTPAAATITAFGGNGSTGGTLTFATSGATTQAHLSPGNLILANSGGAVSAVSGSIGTLTTADVTLVSGNYLDYVLGKPGKGTGANAGLGSLLSITNGTTNNLTLPAGTGSLILNLADNAGANAQGSLGTGTYKLATFGGTLANFTAGNGISTGTFKIGLTPLPTYATYTISSTAASNGEIDLAIRAGGPLGVIASDNAANAAYSGGWAAGSNGGSGYGAWASANSATNAGQFISSSPEIDTGASKAFGSFANSGSIADFSRPITNNLQIGHTLAFDFDNKSVQSGGSDGVTLKAGNTTAFEFFFAGGSANYSVTDSGGSHQLTSPTLGFASTGLHVDFTLTSPTTYSLVVTPAAGGAAKTYSGTLANAVNASSTPISTFRVFDFNSGSGAANNFYINTTNILLPTWNGQNVGAAGGTFSNSANWAAHAPVNGGSIAFDGAGSTVTDDSATSGITSLTSILFNSTGNSAGGPNAAVTTNAGTFTLQSSGLIAGTGLTLAAGITNNSTNVQNINFAGTSGAVGLTLSAAQTFNGGLGGLAFGANTGVNLNGITLTVQGTGSGTNAVKFGGVLSGAGAGSMLNKQQSGTLVLNAAATFAGATTIGVAPNTGGGTIQLGVLNGLPTGTNLTFFDNGISRSTLDLHGFSQTIAGLNDGGNNSGLITNAGAGTPTFTLNNSSANFFYGQISGSLAFAKTGASSQELGGANTFSGGAAVKSGTIIVGATSVGTTSGALGPSANLVTLGDTSGNANANLFIGRAGGSGPGATGGFTLANNITAQDGNSGTLMLGGQNTSGVNSFSGNISLGSTTNTAKDLTLVAAAGGEVDFTGNLLKNGNSGANINVGNASNTGVIKIFGASTYTGATNVNNGRLILSPSSSLSTSSINVAGGATLSAQAGALGLPVGGGLSLAAGSTFDMLDNGTGVLNLNGAGTALTIGAASGIAPTLNFEIGNAATGADRIAVMNNVSVGAIGGKITITPVTGLTSITSGNYNLITSAGGFSGIGGNGFTLNTSSLTASGKTYNLSLINSTTTNEILTVTVAAPTTAYWSGAASGPWNSISSGDVTNWRTDATSNIDTQQILGPTTNVFFATTTPVAANLANTLGADFSIASLTFNSGSAAATIGGANILTIGAGGIVNNAGSLQTINTNGLTLSAAETLNAGAAAGGSLSIGALGTSTLSNGGNRLTVTGANDSTINSAISGTGDLLKQGTGMLVLNGSSTFGPAAAGATNLFIDQGTVNLGNGSAAGSTANTGRIALGSSVTTNQDSSLGISAAGVNVPNPIDVRHFPGVNGAKSIGAANPTGTATYSGDITLHDNVTLTAGGGTLSFAGAISTGSAGAPYANEDVFTGIPTGGFNPGPAIMTAGSGTIELTGANTFNGEIIVNNAITLQARGGGTFGSGANNAVRMYGSSTVNIADATSVSTRINPHGTPGGDTETIGATNAAATTATYAGPIFLDDNSTLSSATSGANLSFTSNAFDIKNHVLTATGAGDTNISAVISNSIAGGSLVKTGAGTLSLSAAAGNTFSGGAAIGGGTLRASNTSGSATGSGAVNVNNGGTLAGTGFITGPVNINAGGTLSPGNSPGTIALGATTYNDGGAYRWEISNWTGAQGAGFDFQSTTGSLAIAATPGAFPANTFKIDLTGLNGSVPGNIPNFDNAHGRSWTIAEASAGISGFAANKFTIDTTHIADNLAGGVFSLSTVNGAGSIQDLVLTFTPGTSPTSYNLAAVANAANIHVSSAGNSTTNTITVTITNAGAATADALDYTGLNVSPSGGTLGNPATLPKDGGPLANRGGSDSGTITFSSSTAGSFTLTPTVATTTNHNLTGNAAAGSTTTASVTVWRLASANGLSSPGNLGAFHVGATVQSALSVTNMAAADGFSEKLDASLGGATGDATTSGSIGLLAPQASDSSSLVLGVDASTPGSKSGSATVTFTSNGIGTSNVGVTPVGSQILNISAQVFSGKMAWNPAAGSGNWGTAANWSDTLSSATAGAPGLAGPLSAGDTATFDSATAPATVSLVNSSPHVATIVFSGANAYMIAPGAGSGVLHLDNGAGVAAIMATSGGHALSAPIRLDSNLALNVTHAGDMLAISGGIGDGGAGFSVTKLGPGTVALSGVNTFGGATQVSNGTLRTAAASALSPNSPVTLSGGRLDVSGFGNTVAAITIGGGGTLQVGLGPASTSNTVASTGAATFAGTLAISGTPTLGSYTLVTYASESGAFSSATNFPGYGLVYAPSSLLLERIGAIGQITTVPSSGSIITGGSLPFSITVQNAAPPGGSDLNFSAAAGTNVTGSIAGPVNVPPQGVSAPQPGLSFNGTAVGHNQTGTFSVSDPNAGNSPLTGAIAVNVLDHALPSDDTGAPGSFAGGMLDLGNIHQGYSAPVTTAGSLAVFNGAVGDNRVALSGSGAQTGGPTAGLSLNGIGGGGAIGPGASATIKATLAPGLASGPINQNFTYTFADDSSLNGASSNVGVATITVIGNVYSGQSIWRGRQAFNGAAPQAAGNGGWGNFSNWSGGSPGLDPSFTTTDSATFGAQAGNVTVDLAGVAPRLNSLVFNHTGNYTIVDSTGTGSLTLSGSSPSITAAGTHSIAVPLTLATNTAVTVTASGDSLTISGRLTLAGAGSTLAKSGNGTLEIVGPPVLNSASQVAVAAGTLRFNIASPAGSVGTGVTASVSQGATLELVGSGSALTDASNNLHRADVANDGALRIGNPALAASTTQQVGAIDGLGDVIVTGNASLTANHINQASLVIGANGLVTIAASDIAGNPLDASATSPLAALKTAAPMIPESAASFLSVPNVSDLGVAAPQILSLVGLGDSTSPAVPEPSSWLLAMTAIAAAVLAGARRSRTTR